MCMELLCAEAAQLVRRGRDAVECAEWPAATLAMQHEKSPSAAQTCQCVRPQCNAGAVGFAAGQTRAMLRDALDGADGVLPATFKSGHAWSAGACTPALSVCPSLVRLLVRHPVNTCRPRRVATADGPGGGSSHDNLRVCRGVARVCDVPVFAGCGSAGGSCGASAESGAHCCAACGGSACGLW